MPPPRVTWNPLSRNILCFAVFPGRALAEFTGIHIPDLGMPCFVAVNHSACIFLPIEYAVTLYTAVGSGKKSYFYEVFADA
jgi:hypothetical protein